MSMKAASSSIRPEPWNKGRLIGQKRPLKPKEVWAIRVRLEIAGTKRNLALFNLAIDSKLRACDLVVLRIEDVCLGVCVRDRATIIQRKTGRPVQFEITEATRAACRFLGRRSIALPGALRLPASEKRQGTKSRDVEGGRFSGLYGDLGSARMVP